MGSPTAMRCKAPNVNSRLYTQIAMPITLPFNSTLGKPIYLFIIQSF
ncbi:sodium-dependent bicarbonate transport family permease [Sediminicola arcticus]|uniref:Sodium-dependent bicarbonate transport family permease n=1 Tax=Sediminicola arcticus TaxID=1574308 RepID=A0ABV2SQ23_9FLAO